MTRGDQFRPGPPPSLTSEAWARDYNEIKAIGSKNSTQRTPEQTAIAKFWEATAPAVYWPVARSVASVPGREVTDNARLLAVAAMAMDDGLIAVFDAKYTYNLWRPVTAIRNGDLDGNDATTRDPGWTPFIDTPMHPEYPCAHCIVSGSLGAVLEAEIGAGPVAEAELGQLDRGGRGAHVDERARFHAGGGGGTHLRWRTLPQLDGGRLRNGTEDRRARGEELPQTDALTPAGTSCRSEPAAPSLLKLSAAEVRWSATGVARRRTHEPMTEYGERGSEAIERVPTAATEGGALRVDEQLAALARRCDQIVPEADLRAKLERSARTGTPLRVKLGMDPTAPDVTLGHAVPLRVVRQFQDWGHRAVLIIGDYTARVGDPSGRNATRPILSGEAIDANAATYVAQVGKILRTDPAHLEVRRNGEWLAGMSLVDVIRLASRATVAQMLQRDDFAARFAGRVEIRLHEILYPLLQGWDSVMIAADVELGGRDQLFNNLVGREIQRQEGGEGQVVIVTPLLVGPDGKEKMSKSRGNYIGVTDPPAGPDGMFGKIMSLPDTLMDSYYTLLTDEPPERYRPRLAADPRAGQGRARPPARALAPRAGGRGRGGGAVRKAVHARRGAGRDARGLRRRSGARRPPTAAAAGASGPGREQRRGRAQDARGRGLRRWSPRHRHRPDRDHRSAHGGEAGPALRPPPPLTR